MSCRLDVGAGVGADAGSDVLNRSSAAKAAYFVTPSSSHSY